MSLLLVSVSERAVTVHLAVLPLTRIHATIRPLECTVAMALVIQVVAFVDASIWPGVLATAMHVTRMPLTDEFSPIQPFISTVPLHLIIDPVAGLESSIWPEVCTKSILFALLEMTIES